MGIQLKPLSASARLIAVMIMISFTFGTVARIGTQFGSKVVKNGCVYNRLTKSLEISPCELVGSAFLTPLPPSFSHCLYVERWEGLGIKMAMKSFYHRH